MRKGESGYALLVVLLLAALVLIGLSTAVPRLLIQGQRENEEELIFRGEQYRRAIGLYYKKFARYPQEMEDLLHSNDRSFLRRLYPDPMTPDGKWRVIRVAANGALIGSVRKPVPSGASEDPGSQEEPEAPEETGDITTESIAGVGSESRARAIKVYEGYSHYHEWEFIYDPTKDLLRVPPGTPPGPGKPGVPPAPSPRPAPAPRR